MSASGESASEGVRVRSAIAVASDQDSLYSGTVSRSTGQIEEDGDFIPRSFLHTRRQDQGAGMKKNGLAALLPSSSFRLPRFKTGFSVDGGDGVAP
jgi:hypothetical protein